MTSNIRVTSAESLEDTEFATDVRPSSMNDKIDDQFTRESIAGYLVGDATVVCHKCIGTEESDFDDPSRIFATDEHAYPGTTCEDCGKTLDTYLIVRKNTDTELYYRLEQAESLGLRGVPSLPEIGQEARREGYQVGWETVGQMFEGSHAEGGEFEDSDPEPTRHGNYDTDILPRLRGIAGYDDRGHGTYQDCYFDVSADILSEDVVNGYIAGYCDRAEGNEHGESLEV